MKIDEIGGSFCWIERSETPGLLSPIRDLFTRRPPFGTHSFSPSLSQPTPPFRAYRPCSSSFVTALENPKNDVQKGASDPEPRAATSVCAMSNGC